MIMAPTWLIRINKVEIKYDLINTSSSPLGRWASGSVVGWLHYFMVSSWLRQSKGEDENEKGSLSNDLLLRSAEEWGSKTLLETEDDSESKSAFTGAKNLPGLAKLTNHWV